MEELATTKWKSTRVGTPPLEGDELTSYLNRLNHGWRIINDKKLEKEFKFSNFNRALEFANMVGKLADELNHHPDLHLAWGKCTVQIWTHRINGLAVMDFVYAARIEKLFESISSFE